MNKLIHLAFLHLVAGTGCPAAESEQEFRRLAELEWHEVFHDPCTEDWKERWTLDGLKARVSNGEKGMDFFAGPDRKSDPSHAVMWTKASFAGDLRLDYEYTKLDDQEEAVTILYLQATGSGAEGYDRDISKWARQREVPSMRTYFNHMNLLHISYAAFGVGNKEAGKDYVRARRYLPETGKGLKGTELEPSYFETGMFRRGVPHQITVIRMGADLWMWIRDGKKEQLCHWNAGALPPVTEGRIGLRHMWTRGARYRDFRIARLKK